MSEAGDDGDIRVEDRRRFDAEGSPREGGDEPGQAEDASATSTPSPCELPEIDFSTFIISLSSSAMMHLGVDPSTGKATGDKQLEMAKQTIDILGLLRKKTKGNLTDTETKLLDELLYNLRMAFLQYCQ